MAVVSTVVVLDYLDLITGKDLSADIATAFGFDGLGVLTVKNVPGLSEARGNLLPLGREFALLDDETKLKYTHEQSKYSFGWSHGKEKLQGGKPDTSKGSYYANPQFDRPVDDEAIIEQYPAFVYPNIWPTEELPALEGAFKTLGRLIVEVGKLVAMRCDVFIKSQVPTYQEGRLFSVIDTSLCCKARLLHYFPLSSEGDISTPPLALSSSSSPPAAAAASEGESDFSSWCGWHNDHGSLTGLTSAMFFSSDGRLVENTDPSAGLYCRSRKGE